MSQVDNAKDLLKVGQVSFRTILGDIRTLPVDVLVQPSGTSPIGSPMHVSPWVIDADVDRTITKALSVHHPFRLGDVIVTSAGNLNAKYLFSAIVIDWGRQAPQDDLISYNIILSTARKCIDIAVALGVKSIAFTPWGTRVGAMDPSHVTALLVQAITSSVQEKAGALEYIYFISNDSTHYQWFIDRTFMFHVMFDQVMQLRHEIENLNISGAVGHHFEKLLDNLQYNLNVVLDQSHHVNTGGGTYVEGNVSAGANFIGRDQSNP